jgi:hypothetical protein
VNTTGDTVYLGAGGTSSITTLTVADGIGGGVLTERPGSPTQVGYSPCEIVQPRLSPSLFVVSTNTYELYLYSSGANTSLPVFLDRKSMFAGSYCSMASDPYGKFIYVPKFNDVADYLFGFRVAQGGSTLEPLPLNPLPPENTYTLPTAQPRAMVLRYSHRDREAMQIEPNPVED